jgi:hypothetical protein
MTYCLLELYVDIPQTALPWGSAPEENKMILSYHVVQAVQPSWCFFKHTASPACSLCCAPRRRSAAPRTRLRRRRTLPHDIEDTGRRVALV